MNIIASLLFNPLTLISDQDRISPYNINTVSTRQVTRKKLSELTHGKKCMADNKDN